MARLLRSLDLRSSVGDRGGELMSPAPPSDSTEPGLQSTPVAAAGAALASVPDTVPLLPDGFDPSSKYLKQLIELILSPDGASSGPDGPPTNAVGAPALGWVCAAGMGGLGKTTMASAAVRDHEIRKQFDRLVFVSVGQTPSILALQQAMSVLPRGGRVTGAAGACMRMRPAHPI